MKTNDTCLKQRRTLPVIGGLTGQGAQSNLEVILKAKPDLVIMWSAKKSAVAGRVDEALKQLNLPLVYAVAESLNDYPDVYLFLGRLLGKEERTKKLSAYFQKTLSDAKKIVDRIPKEKRPAVYYAEGVDGLSTECNDSIHVELLQLAGDTDVHGATRRAIRAWKRSHWSRSSSISRMSSLRRKRSSMIR